MPTRMSRVRIALPASYVKKRKSSYQDDGLVFSLSPKAFAEGNSLRRKGRGFNLLLLLTKSKGGARTFFLYLLLFPERKETSPSTISGSWKESRKNSFFSFVFIKELGSRTKESKEKSVMKRNLQIHRDGRHSDLLLLPPVGLEPTRRRHEFLKLACLPIPSQGLFTIHISRSHLQIVVLAIF